MLALASTIRSELLDCIQVNLAVLADRHYGPATYLALGAPLRFRPRPADTSPGLPTVEPPCSSQIDDAIRRLGLVAKARWRRLPVAQLRAETMRHGPLYAVADSYWMPWLPYAGRRHMEHSFLVTNGGNYAEISDGYLNQTQWGAASPGRWNIDWAELPATITLALALESDERGAPPTAPVIECDSPDEYVDAYARHPDRLSTLEQLAVETWLLTRSRKLHAAFRAWAARREQPAVARHLELWERVATRAFLNLRRLHGGRPESSRLLDDLHSALAADPRVFAGETPLGKEHLR
jgi:hypothetical protein